MVVKTSGSPNNNHDHKNNAIYNLLPTQENTCREPKISVDRASTQTVINQSTLSPSIQQYVQNFSLIFLTIQQTINPLMVRKAHKDAEGNKMEFLSSAVVFTTEILRIGICCSILTFTHGSIGAFLMEIKNTFMNNKRETLKVCLPALIYVIQNNLYFFALKRVEATLFSITYNLRILTTALLSMLLLKRVFSFVQWTALFISLIGVVLVQLSSQQNRETLENNEEKRRNEFTGLIVIVVMCWSSAFAGVYLEGVLKKSSCDIGLQNIRLSLITLPFSVMTLMNDHEVITEHGIYYGWTYIVWTIAFSSAVSGIVVAAVMKYADNIKKSYCQSMALGGTACLSIFLGDSKFSYGLLAGVSLVIISVFLYTINPKWGSMNEEQPIEIELNVIDSESDEWDEEEAENRDFKEENSADTTNSSHLKRNSVTRESLVHIQCPTIIATN